MNDEKKDWQENLAAEYNDAMKEESGPKEDASQVSYSKSRHLSVTHCILNRDWSFSGLKDELQPEKSRGR